MDYGQLLSRSNLFLSRITYMNPREHYSTHLAAFYSWMAGDFEAGVEAFNQNLHQWNLSPSPSAVAIDLGAGHGM
ncbi:MAG: hypothetical protein AAF399_27345 [Bacteroidota bacterium]